jgi:hypothetical protein
MKRIASILTGLSLAVLFFVASAHAQYEGQKMIANIPFEFTVGSISFPAGQYEFMRTGAGANIFRVRDADGNSLFIMASVPIRGNGLTEKSNLKFATVDGRHILIQIWNEPAAIGNEFHYGQTYTEFAKHTTIQ